MNNNILLTGWASEDITPSKKVLLFGQFDERISKGVHDPLSATALAIESKNEDGEIDQAVIISCDLIGSEKPVLEKLRAAVKEELSDLDVSKIITCAIHTHTAPTQHEVSIEGLHWSEFKKLSSDEFMTPPEFVKFLVQKLKKAVIAAWNSRKPSKASWELGHAVVGHCRRVVYDDGSARMYGETRNSNFENVEATSDHGVELMYFWNMDDELTGVIVNVACPAQVVEGSSYISADYFGAARRMIKERFSDKVYVLPQIGSAGDQSPRDLVRRGKSETNMDSFEGMEELGSRVADAVENRYASAKKNMQGHVVFKHTAKEIYLPIRKVTHKEIEQANQNYSEIMKKYTSEAEVQDMDDLINLIINKAVIQRQKLQEKVSLYKMELHAIRLGDTAFVTNPFELYLDYGLQIKARSKAVQTFVVQLSCSNDAYLPTRRALTGGSYGTNIADGIVGPDAGELLVEESLHYINSMWYGEELFGEWVFARTDE